MNDSSGNDKLRKKIRLFIVITIVGLLANGLSAFFIEPELNFVLHFPSLIPDQTFRWLTQVRDAVSDSMVRYPYMLYGYDWLGFAHLLIAIAFLGPLRDPIKNEWVVKFGMIAASLSILMALIFERFRSVPFFWSLVDVSVGFCALIVLYFCNNWIEELKRSSSVK